ncbi:MAG: Uma2 family endonuclease [Desulfobacterales bacterium]|nr:Uma2 family endonuclease [Desulfobacterales bacterium]
MGQPSLKKEKYTYSDYCKWNNEERWELIEGIPYCMASPSRKHQRISGNLFAQIHNFLFGKECEVYSAPFDVRLPNKSDEHDKDIETIVQPDISVICDRSKLDDKGCLGAPDFIIEILSPSTASKDHITKVNLYEKNKVKEYWIVDTENKIIFIYLLNENKKYSKPIIHDGKGNLDIINIQGLTINLDLAFN